MKGFKHQSNLDTIDALKDSLILKSLPYGKWITEENKEYLFNRDYEPILGWDLTSNIPVPVTPNCCIRGIIEEKTELYYGGGVDYPTRDVKTLRKCWDILADWSKRLYSKNQ